MCVRLPTIAVFWEIEVADFNEDVRSFTGSSKIEVSAQMHSKSVQKQWKMFTSHQNICTCQDIWVAESKQITVNYFAGGCTMSFVIRAQNLVRR